VSRDIAIDLGTANTLVHVQGRGIVVDEPTVMAMNERTGEVVGVGADTWRILDAAPLDVVAVRPLRHGSITDFDLTERLMRGLFQRAGVGRFRHPRALIAVSSVSNTVERRAIVEAARQAGAKEVLLIDEPMAAAIGAGLPIDEPSGNCVIDVGGGTTEIAVVSMGGVVATRAIRVGGFDLDDAIRQFLRETHGLTVGERAAEEIKRAVCSAMPGANDPRGVVTGRELSTGAPKTVEVGAEDFHAAVDNHVRRVLGTIQEALSETPPELGHDVIERGMLLTGGGGMLRGLSERIQEETKIPVRLADEPLRTVCLGAGRALGVSDELAQRGILTG
jgi:rod shape-determining protein MreB